MNTTPSSNPVAQDRAWHRIIQVSVGEYYGEIERTEPERRARVAHPQTQTVTLSATMDSVTRDLPELMRHLSIMPEMIQVLKEAKYALAVASDDSREGKPNLHLDPVFLNARELIRAVLSRLDQR